MRLFFYKVAPRPFSSSVTALISSLVVTMTMLVSIAFAEAARAAVIPAKPAWSLEIVPKATSLSSGRDTHCQERPNVNGSCEAVSLVLSNSGSRATEGPATVTDVLPPGLEIVNVESDGLFSWACSTESLGSQERVVCTTEESVPALSPAPNIEIRVVVASGLSGPILDEAEVSGGSAPPVQAHASIAVGGASLLFGPLDFSAAALDPAGAVATQAASHPGALTASFFFPTEIRHGNTLPFIEPRAYGVQEVKQIVSDLPPGLIGNALAAPTCPLSNLSDRVGEELECPRGSRVGTGIVLGHGGNETQLAIYNVPPEHGYPAAFGIFAPNVFGRAVVLYASVVGSGADTHIQLLSGPQNGIIENIGVSLTFFGNPTAINFAKETAEGKKQPVEPVALATTPADCDASGFTTKVYADSWQQPGRVLTDGQPDLSDPNWKSAASMSPPVTGCELLQFHPALSFGPEWESGRADEPSGYGAVLRVPQNEDPDGLATPPLKDTVVTLPAGVAISPGAANGLVGCELGPAGIGLEGEVESSQPGHCPDASRVGEVEAVTPVLKEPLSGGVFVAEPSCAPCSEAQAEDGEVFALYLELGNEVSGVHVKIRGKVEVGGNGQHSREVGLVPGQVRTTFAETPQDPVSELKLKFNGGQRAPLANPQSCGSFTTGAVLEPWSHTPAPGEKEGTPNATLNPSFGVGGCGNGFAPSFDAGTSNPRAGGYSPFALTFSRQDREQDLSGVTVSMPPGLLGKIAGIPRCGEAQANAGTCPAVSQVGTATGGAGSGSEPLYQSGPVYLTGPYKGAPFGLSIAVPAVAGPFNLGNIVVRAAIYVNPTTAAITVVSDPLPQSVDGVPLRLKTVNVTVGANGAFTFNPTNCGEQKIAATLTGTGGASVPVSSRFQAANCASLPFKPVLSASTAGSASKANGASLDVKVSYPSGPIGSYANIKSVKVDLPKQLPSRLTTLQKACVASVFEANPANCPSASDVGTAMASTSVLNVPLTGPAYLVSHGGEAFPDLEIVLQGEGVMLVLDGSTLIKKGITSSTFKAVPDAPVSGFELRLPMGKYSILSSNVPESAKFSLCGQSLSMPTVITGQNGAVIKQTTKIAVTGCPKAATRSLTRAQKLRKALKACNKQAKGLRAACERAARKRYGLVEKSKKK